MREIRSMYGSVILKFPNFHARNKLETVWQNSIKEDYCSTHERINQED